MLTTPLFLSKKIQKSGVSAKCLPLNVGNKQKVLCITAALDQNTVTVGQIQQATALLKSLIYVIDGNAVNTYSAYAIGWVSTLLSTSYTLRYLIHSVTL